MPSFFFWMLQLTSFTFNLWFLNVLKHKVRLPKVVCGNFDSVSFSLQFIFLFNKMHGFFHFKTSEFLSYSYSKVTHSFAPRPLIFYLQQEVLKFNDIFVSWSSPKLTQRQIFKLRKYTFWERQYFSVVTFVIDICLLKLTHSS